METAEQMRERHLQVLKYGDTITLSATDAVQGFLSASAALQPQVRVEQTDDEDNVPTNIQDCRFQVQQRFMFEDKFAYDKKMEELSLTDDLLDALLASMPHLDSGSSQSGRSRKGPSGQGPLPKGVPNKMMEYAREKISRADLTKVVALRREMEHEWQSNQEEFKRSVGDVVMYGDTIQLYHVSSGCYLSIRKTAALVERGNLLAVLEEYPCPGSCFVVRSGYRTRSEGDSVVFKEVITLKSQGFRGMFIAPGKLAITEHSMLPPLPAAAAETSQSYEVSAGSVRGRFKIIPYSLHHTLMKPNKLNGCSVISLTMGNEQLLLADKGKIRFQHNGLMHPTTRSRLPPRAGSDGVPGRAMWRLEPETADWAGQPMPVGVVCRLRHLATNMLLAVEEPVHGKDEKAAPRICMRSQREGNTTLWKLHSFTAEPSLGANEALLREQCHVFLQHARGMWLTIGGRIQEEEKEKNAEQPFNASTPLLESRSAELSAINMDSNVLSLREIPPALEARAMMMAESLFIIQDFVHHLKEDCTPIKLGSWSEASVHHIHEAVVASGVDSVFDTCWSRVQETIEALNNVTIDRTTHGEGGDNIIRSYQQLAMEMRVIDNIIESLKILNLNVLYGSSGKQYTDMYHRGRCMIKYGERCHKFLQQVVRNAPELQNYVAPFIDVLKADLGGPVRAADTLAAIYHGNMRQIQMIDSSILEAIIKLIATTGRRPHYLNFLSRVCGTAERPVPSNQNRLLVLLMEHAEDVVVSACYDEAADDWIISVQDSDQETKVNCSELASVAADEKCAQIADWPPAGEDDKYRLFVYYIYLLDLYRGLCHSRNQISQKNLQEMDQTKKLGLDYKSLLKGIQSNNLPNALRTALVQVMQVLHVDREPFQPLALPKNVRLLSPQYMKRAAIEEDASGANQMQGSASLAEFAELCHTYLKGVLDARLSDHTRGRNALTMQVTQSVDTMFRLGVIALDSEIAAPLLEALQDMLTGFDIHSQHVMKRFVDKDGNDVVMAIKSCILGTFDYVLDLQMEHESATVFDAFSRQRQQQHADHRNAWGGAENGGQGGSDPPAQTTSKEAYKTGEAEARSFKAHMEEQATANTKANKYIPWSSTVAALSKLDMFSPQCFQFQGKPNPTVVAILQLMRYENPKLKGQAINLVERLLSKSRKLARLLMDTQVVNNDAICAMYIRCKRLLVELRSQTKWIASLENDVRQEALDRSMDAISELITMLTPGERVIADDTQGAVAVGHAQRGNLGSHSISGDLEGDGNDDGDGPDSLQEVITITKEHVSLMQAMARDLDAHQVVLTFLKLPLRTRPGKNPSDMPEAVEEGRRELFSLCYQFLSRFAGGSENPEVDTQNRHNQKLLFAKLPLYMSHIGIRNLNVTNTLVGIFASNSDLARKVPASMISQFFHIIVKFGGKQHTRWLRFLQAVVTVDGKPVGRNQRLVLSLLDDHEEQVCELFLGAEGRRERLRLMKENEHAGNMEEGKQADGSRLNYHRVTVQLIADCCVGENPTFVVKASGFLPITEALTCLCSKWNEEEGVQVSTGRFIKSAYCSFLRRVYLMPNTDNARRAVADNSDLIWPTEEFYRSRMAGLRSPEERSRSGSRLSVPEERSPSPKKARAPPGEEEESTPRGAQVAEGVCLVHVVMEEVEAALEEPSDALANNPGSATYYLAAHLMPALASYFANHFFAFYGNLPAGLQPAYDGTIDELLESIRKLQRYVKDLPAEQQDFVKTWRRACRSIDSALDAIETHISSRKDGGEPVSPLGRDLKIRPSFSETDGSQFTAVLGSQVIQAEWRGFISELASAMNMYIDFARYEAVEEEGVDGFDVEYASLWRMARLLTGPHGASLEGTKPAWSYPAAVQCLARYMVEERERVVGEWEEETLVKVLRVLRAVVHMDDGVVDAAAWREGWRRTLGRERLERSVHEKETWVQDKYNALGFTQLAVHFMAAGTPAVAMEAMYLLAVLMQEGNRGVQDAAHDLLAGDMELGGRWFGYLASTFDAYIAHHQEADPLQAAGGGSGRSRSSRDSGSQSRGSRRNGAGSARSMPHRETTEVASRMPSMSVDDDEDLDLTPVVTLNDANDPNAVCLEVMRLLNAMCEGIHSRNQALLRSQPQNATSTNFIHRAVDVLNVLQNKLHELPGPRSDDDQAALDAYEATLSKGMVTVFRLLNEVVQGPCRENQLAMLVGCPLLLLSNRVLHYTLYDPQHIELADMEGASALKCNLLSLLCGLLEGNRPGDEEIPTRIIDILNTKLLDRQVQILFIIFGRAVDNEYSRDANARLREIAVKELTLFFSFLDKLDVVVVESKSWLAYLEEHRRGKDSRQTSAHSVKGVVGPHADEFKAEFLGSVEVLWKGQVEKVFFPLTEECQDNNTDWQWRDRARLRLQDIHPDMRANTIQKGIELMRLMRKLEDDIETDSKLLHEAPVVHWIAQQDKTSNQAAFYLSCITLVALLVLLPVPHSGPDSASPSPGNLLQGAAYHVVKVLVVLELVCCLFVMCAFMCGDVRRWWLHNWQLPVGSRDLRYEALGRWLFKNFGLRAAARLLRRVNITIFPGKSGGGVPQKAGSSFRMSRVTPLSEDDSDGGINIPDPPMPENDRPSMPLHIVELLLFLATSFKFWFTAVQIVFALLTLLVNEFFIVGQLLTFFVEFEAGIMLMGALKVAGASLIRTAAMGLIIIVLFAVFGYIFFNEPSGVDLQMYNWAGDQPACGSFYQCTFSHLIAGMMGDLSPMYTNDHGELWKYVPLAIQDSAWLQWRSFFVIMFFIIWTFILSNIFTGQIVDAFASIRDDKRLRDQDTNSKCLCCSIDRFVLDQQSERGFEHHVAEDHNPLHYVYYLHYLRRTEPEDYRGCDSHVAKLLVGPEPHSWLPIGRALAVEQRGMSNDAEQREQARLEAEQMARHVKSVEAMVTEIRSQMDERLGTIEAHLEAGRDAAGEGGAGRDSHRRLFTSASASAQQQF